MKICDLFFNKKKKTQVGQKKHPKISQDMKTLNILQCV